MNSDSAINYFAPLATPADGVFFYIADKSQINRLAHRAGLLLQKYYAMMNSTP